MLQMIGPLSRMSRKIIKVWLNDVLDVVEGIRE